MMLNQWYSKQFNVFHCIVVKQNNWIIVKSNSIIDQHTCVLYTIIIQLMYIWLVIDYVLVSLVKQWNENSFSKIISIDNDLNLIV